MVPVNSIKNVLILLLINPLILSIIKTKENAKNTKLPNKTKIFINSGNKITYTGTLNHLKKEPIIIEIKNKTAIG